MTEFTFKDIFSYKSIELCKDFPERDSDSYVDCVMLKSLDGLQEGQRIPFICVSVELVSGDIHTYLYDKDIQPPFPFTYKTSSNGVECPPLDELSNRTERAFQDKEVVYYDCEMLQDIGDFTVGEEYAYIIVITSLFAFNDNGELIFNNKS